MGKVEFKDIHPELRLIGHIFSTFFPSFNEKTFKMANESMKCFMKGKWLGKKSIMQEVCISRKDGSLLRLCVCYPKNNVGTKNTGLLWIHGGGYAIGLPEQDFSFVDLFTEDENCIVVMPDYRKSTEAPYPAALDDCYLAFLWMKENADALGINEHQLFIGGDSAGGGLTAALSLYARDQKTVDIAFQMPLYPMMDDRMTTDSCKDNNAPIWNYKSNKEGWKLYLGGIEEVPVYAVPSRATDYSGLPPTLTYVGTIEPFYDETCNYVKALKEAGVKVAFKSYKGCFHGFDILGGFTGPGRHARKFLKAGFQHAQRNFYTE